MEFLRCHERYQHAAGCWPGDACKYIKHCEAEIKPDDKVVLVCRVSTENQRPHLHAQELALRRWVAARGAVVVGVVHRVGRGCDDDYGSTHLTWLRRVALKAIAKGATIIAESTKRLIRHPGFSERWRDAQARDTDLADLSEYTLGVPLTTLLHPNAPPAEVCGYQTKRGGGGRPSVTRPGYKKARREELLPRVREMLAAGCSVRYIARTLTIPRRTARAWEGHFLAATDLLKGQLTRKTRDAAALRDPCCKGHKR